MNSQERELLRNNLLIQLDYGSSLGVRLDTVHQGARLAGFPVEQDAVTREVDYLVDKGLAVDVAKTVSPENRRVRITAEGRDHLATLGLAR